MPAWIGTLFGWIGTFLVAVLKGLFGMDKPCKTTVSHPKPELEVDDGKSDAQRMDDLGM